MTDAAGSTSDAPSAGDWVDDILLSGDDSEVCLWLGGPVDRRELRRLVTQREKELAATGLLAGGTATLRLPPSLTYIASLLAAWRIGAQVSLLDHRLTDHEVARALERLEPQVVVSAAGRAAPGPMRAYADVTASDEARPSGPVRTYTTACVAASTAVIDAGVMIISGRAGMRPAEIGYVNASGTGTSHSDASEAAALHRAFGPLTPVIPVSSTKSVHGHALEASALLELVVTVLALRHGQLPVNAGFLEPAPECELALVLATRQPLSARHAMSLNAAFGGANTALVVSAP